MATLNIRNLPDPVHARLRLRAARLGRSMEAEAREILSSACRPAVDDEQLLALQDLNSDCLRATERASRWQWNAVSRQ